MIYDVCLHDVEKGLIINDSMMILWYLSIDHAAGVSVLSFFESLLVSSSATNVVMSVHSDNSDVRNRSNGYCCEQLVCTGILQLF